jgi:hypothetical protein
MIVCCMANEDVLRVIVWREGRSSSIESRLR